MPRGNPSGRQTRSARGRYEDQEYNDYDRDAGRERSGRHSHRGAVPSSRMPSDRISMLNMETDVDFDYQDDDEDYHSDEDRRPMRLRSRRERARYQFDDDNGELEDRFDEDEIPYDDEPRRQPRGRANAKRSPSDRPSNRRGNR